MTVEGGWGLRAPKNCETVSTIFPPTPQLLIFSIYIRTKFFFLNISVASLIIPIVLSYHLWLISYYILEMCKYKYI